MTMIESPRLIPDLEKIASRATADIARLLREAYELGRGDMRRELMALLSPASGNTVATVGEVHVATIASVRTSTKAPPGTVRPAIFKMIEESSGVSTDQILTATCFKENSVRGTLSTLHKEGKIARNAQGYWIRILEAPAEQLAEAS
jgi:hypothetical protein